MISVTNLTKAWGADTLFEDVSLQLNDGCRYGLVGANGSGKSTFLRILAGEEIASDGEINIPKRARVGFLKQDHFRYEDTPILDVAMMGKHDVWAALAEREKLLAHSDDEEFDTERYAEVEDFILRSDGYSLEARAGEVLEGLGIPTLVHREPMRILSGGFKLRVLLAQALAADPDVLLLDEPTNHLDILSIRWLEKFLSTYKGCAVVISHDHRFLDNVATHILDVDYETILLYNGNYTRFAEAKVEERERKESQIEKQRRGDRAPQGVHRPLQGQGDQGAPGEVEDEADRAHRHREAAEELAPLPGLQVQAAAAVGPAGADDRGDLEGLRRQPGARRTSRSPCSAATAWRSSAPTASASRRCSRSRWAASPPTAAGSNGATRPGRATSRRTTASSSTTRRRRSRRGSGSSSPAR